MTRFTEARTVSKEVTSLPSVGRSVAKGASKREATKWRTPRGKRAVVFSYIFRKLRTIFRERGEGSKCSRPAVWRPRYTSVSVTDCSLRERNRVRIMTRAAAAKKDIYTQSVK